MTTTPQEELELLADAALDAVHEVLANMEIPQYEERADGPSNAMLDLIDRLELYYKTPKQQVHYYTAIDPDFAKPHTRSEFVSINAISPRIAAYTLGCSVKPLRELSDIAEKA